MIRRWARIRTSQWHLLHSIRADTGGNEALLTVDGYYFPTERSKWSYGTRPNPPETTGPRVWEGEGLPRGRICSHCSAFVHLEKRTVLIDDNVRGVA